MERYRYVSRDELVGYLDVSSNEIVVDLGSGTGFYTDDVAPFVRSVYAVDVQEVMHEHYREKGVPENVSLVTADITDLPFEDGEFDAAFSTMTFHEFASENTLTEVARVVRPGGRKVIAEGRGESGPPVEERYDLEAAREMVESSKFEVRCGIRRPETFVLVARR